MDSSPRGGPRGALQWRREPETVWGQPGRGKQRRSPKEGPDHCSPVILIVIEHEGMRSCCSRPSRGGGSSGGIRSGEEAAKTAEMTAGDL